MSTIKSRKAGSESKSSIIESCDIEQASGHKCEACAMPKAERRFVHRAFFRRNSTIATRQSIDNYINDKQYAIWPATLVYSCQTSRINLFSLWLKNSTIDLTELSWKRIAEYASYGRKDDPRFNIYANIIHGSVSIETYNDPDLASLVERICSLLQLCKQLQTLRIIFFPLDYSQGPCLGPQKWDGWSTFAQRLTEHPNLREVDIRAAIEDEILSDEGSCQHKDDLTVEQENRFLDVQEDAIEAHDCLEEELAGLDCRFRLGYELYSKK
jgi:5-methylcytosine-specific restriction endonuclease McrA